MLVADLIYNLIKEYPLAPLLQKKELRRLWPLESPYSYLPDKYRNDPIFLRAWLATVKEKYPWNSTIAGDEMRIPLSADQDEVLTFDSSGSLRKFYLYQKEKMHGVMKRFRNNKQTVELQYVNGARHGVSRFWLGRSNGYLWKETPYLSGAKHGVEKIWKPVSKRLRRIETPYVEGQKHGTIRVIWDDTNEVISETNYFHEIQV
ncbi:MAG: toxin-antitoxin system YwqK family antitoxin [Nitrososphaerales archaeon]